jgi:hypothetical protein
MKMHGTTTDRPLQDDANDERAMMMTDWQMR